MKMCIRDRIDGDPFGRNVESEVAENFGGAHMHKKSLRHKGVALKAQAVKAEGKKFSLVKI